MPWAEFTLTDRALYGLLAVPEEELGRLLRAVEQIRGEVDEASDFAGATPKRRKVNARRVGRFVILYRVLSSRQPVEILDIRAI